MVSHVGMQQDYCVFCEKVIKEREGFFIYEDDTVISFMDHAPVEAGHVLIAPKKHFVNVFDIDDEVFLNIQMIAKIMASAVLKATQADGINIGQNNGPCANQRVMHYHLHIIPRFCGSHINWERKAMSDKDMEAISRKISVELLDLL
jgi:bis(5'-nucleosidyl)-tetraphosphatase/histidine triad (HIT) family protein